jgi:hypothetical protein
MRGRLAALLCRVGRLQSGYFSRTGAVIVIIILKLFLILAAEMTMIRPLLVGGYYIAFRDLGP